MIKRTGFRRSKNVFIIDFYNQQPLLETTETLKNFKLSINKLQRMIFKNNNFSTKTASFSKFWGSYYRIYNFRAILSERAGQPSGHARLTGGIGATSFISSNILNQTLKTKKNTFILFTIPNRITARNCYNCSSEQFCLQSYFKTS